MGGDADILAAMVTAVREFSRDVMRTSLGDTGEGRSSGISFGDRRIVMANASPRGRELIVAALVVGQETPGLVSSIQKLASEIGEENTEWLGRWDGESSVPDSLARRLREFVELPTPVPTGVSEDPKLAYLRALETSIAALTREAERAPVLLFIDDAHWADEPTLGWLHQLARSAKDSPVSMMITYRPEETPDSPEGLDGTLRLIARESRFERLELAPLAPAGVNLLIEVSLGGPVKDPEFLERLFRATGGNPLYVIETTMLSVTEKALTRDGVGWRLARDLKSLTIPTRVRDVVARRVSALSSEERGLAEVAAVLGEEFTLGLVVEVAGTPRKEAAKLLDSLERSHRVIHSTPRGYRFHHSIVRETLYDAVGAGMRRELHAAAAEALERSPGRIDRREELIAWHYAQAGDAERGVPAILKAAGVMERRYDNAAVSRLCGWGIELLRSGPGSFAAADRETEVTEKARNTEVGLLVVKGEAEFRSGRLVEARSTLEEACALALDGGDTNALARASTRLCVTLLNLGDPAKVLEVWEQTSHHIGKGRPIEAARLRRHAADALRMIGRLDEAEEEAKAARDAMERAGAGPGELAGAYHTLANVASARGDPSTAVGLYGKGVALLRSVPTLEEDASLLYSLSASAYNCGVSHMMLGQVDEADALVQDARRIWTRLGDEHGLATSLSTLGDIAVAKGEFEEAERLCAESAALSERLGDVEGVAMARYHRAGVLYELERPAEALESLDAAASMFETQGLETVLPSVFAT
ncbi:MAG TPA: tetratricopeptide repeat protein, partial [Thermoplasmata archaeon]|nr:tetratricopeptide repeat protein [Thermoplasmata archaeon]